MINPEGPKPKVAACGPVFPEPAEIIRAFPMGCRAVGFKVLILPRHFASSFQTLWICRQQREATR